MKVSIYIWGGPYDAREELEDQFSEIVPKEIIDQLIDGLEGECLEWAPIPSEDDYLVEEILKISDYYHNFTDGILGIERLLKADIDKSVEINFHRLLYANVISALEVFLSNAFIGTVMRDEALKRRFFETTKFFQDKKIPHAEVFKAYDNVDDEIIDFLSRISWHNIEKAIPLYRKTLDINFPKKLSQIKSAVLIRHDIVHRNGKTKEDEEHIIVKSDVETLIKSAEGLARHIDTQLKSKPWEDF